jgi:hypothetical protein
MKKIIATALLVMALFCGIAIADPGDEHHGDQPHNGTLGEDKNNPNP